MLSQRRRRRHNIKAALDEGVVFAAREETKQIVTSEMLSKHRDPLSQTLVMDFGHRRWSNIRLTLGEHLAPAG